MPSTTIRTTTFRQIDILAMENIAALPARPQLHDLRFNQFQQLAMAWAYGSPVPDNRLEGSVRNIEVGSRRKGQLAIWFGFQLLHHLCDCHLIGFDESFGHPCSTVLSDDVLGRPRQCIEALSVHQERKRRSAGFEEVVRCGNAFDAEVKQRRYLPA